MSPFQSAFWMQIFVALKYKERPIFDFLNLEKWTFSTTNFNLKSLEFFF